MVDEIRNIVYVYTKGMTISKMQHQVKKKKSIKTKLFIVNKLIFDPQTVLFWFLTSGIYYVPLLLKFNSGCCIARGNIWQSLVECVVAL